ncbi:hypothetical protein [Roseimaritima multifibrata]|uniref:hypothetical protein n=1 Tax=Roseimaritima multifibrata TaxID=1930274 RepID=UPI00119D5FF3|nr:hypothetical protein [Roseimaritima multifibrata]
MSNTPDRVFGVLGFVMPDLVPPAQYVDVETKSKAHSLAKRSSKEVEEEECLRQKRNAACVPEAALAIRVHGGLAVEAFRHSPNVEI